MIDRNGWFGWATRRPAPLIRLGYNGGPKFYQAKAGLVFHSAEGYEETLLDLAQNGPLSWVVSNLKDGRLVQHHAVTAIAYTNGTFDANRRFIGIENEGVAGEPLTEAQITNLVRVARDCRDYFHWSALRLHHELREHNEFVPTACPSGRIPWAEILRRLEEATMPPPTDAQRLAALRILAQAAQAIAERRDLSVEQKALLRYLGS